MALLTNSADAGTLNAAVSTANSGTSGDAINVGGGGAKTYSDTVTRPGRGQSFKVVVTNANTGYLTWAFTATDTVSVMTYGYFTTSCDTPSEYISIRSNVRVLGMNLQSDGKFFVYGVSNDTPLYSYGTPAPVGEWFRTVFTMDRTTGAWYTAMFLGEDTTPLEEASGTESFSSLAAPTSVYYGKRSGAWATTMYLDDPSIDTASTTVLGPTGTPREVGPLGTIAHIGDSTSMQGTNSTGTTGLTGSTDGPAKYVAEGWDRLDLWWYGVGSKDLQSADANGYTTIQNIQQARAVLLETPKVWVIALGTNARTASDATNTTRIDAIMDEIGSDAEVLWVGISQATAAPWVGLDADAARFNALAKSLEATYSNLTFLDLDAFIRNGRNETGLWASPPDANYAHMSTTGYAIRNAIIAAAAKALIATYSDTPALSGSGTLSTSGTLSVPGTATLSGSGTLSTSGTPAFARSAALSGSGTLASSGAPRITQALALSGSGTLSVTGAPALARTVQFSGSGALMSTSALANSGTATLTGFGALTTSGAPVFGASVSFTGTGALSVTGVPTFDGLAAFDSEGVLTGVSATARGRLLVGSLSLSTNTATIERH